MRHRCALFLIPLGLTVIAGLLVGCRNGKSSRSADDKVIHVKAPDSARELWRDWANKYVIFAHRAKPVNELSDFNGREIFCPLVKADASDPGVSLSDVSAFLKAGGLNSSVSMGNDPDGCRKWFLEHPESIGFFSRRVAEAWKFSEDPQLVEIMIR